LHRGGGLGSSVDDISAKHDVIVFRQNTDELLQRLITAMNVTDHPVVAARWHAKQKMVLLH
jgi:hypothetical protein